MPERIGRFLLLKKIATGGMAEVFVARQRGIEGFEKLVVIKKLLPALSRSGKFMGLFLNEAKLAARLAHPNIVQIYDLGIAEGAYFIAMEFIQGENLFAIYKACRKRGQPLPLPLLARIASEACEGLHYAHSKTDVRGQPLGIVHSDISPQNILVSLDGTTKIIDFGVAKAANLARELRADKVVMGKLCYLAPEQCLGRPADARTDLYSLGVVLWELAAGRRLFRDVGTVETMKAIVRSKLPRPGKFNQEVPGSFDKLVMRALDKNPGKRFQNAREMHDALKSVTKEQGWEASAFDLASFLQELFREKLQAARDRQLLEAGDVEMEPALFYDLRAVAGSDGQQDAEGGTPATPANSLATQEPTGDSRPQVSFWKRLPHLHWWHWLLLFFVLATLVGGGYLLLGGKPEKSSPAVAPVAPAGTVNIVSQPAAARVWLDGQLRCLSPCQVPEVAVGPWHELEISRPGYKPFNFRFKLHRAGQQRDFQVRLDRLDKVNWATVKISTRPAGARLELDGQEIDFRTPTTMRRIVPNQTYSLRAFLKGHRDWKTTFKLAPGQVATISGELPVAGQP
ncbi:MAG: hypothetical protein DRI34_01305 [Deltaproteobacteria bacterium]|nr:MAG: hypothetical protein DRI34_01305 [Deltaproteobacteria bacterium]